jgi:outer membrane protein, heavy metal efflux system
MGISSSFIEPAMKRLFLSTLLLAGLHLAPATTLAAAESPPGGADWLDLGALTAEVLAVNPALTAARARWEAMKQRLPQARAWADLQAGMDAENGADNTEWMLMQAIPLSGKNKRAERIANAEAAAALAEVQRLELHLTAQTRVAVVQIASAQEQLVLNQRDLDLLRRLNNAARASYEAGMVSVADVLAVETELAKQQEARVDFDRALADAQSALAQLLNRASTNRLGRAPRLAYTPPKLDPATLQKHALTHRPDLLAARHRIEAADGQVDHARREWIPDPEIRTEVRNFTGGPSRGMVEYDAGIFITVPWLNRAKYRAKIEEARHNASGTRAELEALESETLRHIRDQLKKLETLHHQIAIFSERLIPLAKQTVDGQQAAFESGKADVMKVLMAARELRAMEAMYWHHVADHQMALAELTPMLGGDPHLISQGTATERKQP